MGTYSSDSPYSDDSEPPQNDNPADSGGVKDVSPAQPEQVSPGDEQEGVQVGGLPFTPNLDGTRHYPSQGPVETVDDPTPTPSEDPNAEKPAEASVTNEPVGR